MITELNPPPMFLFSFSAIIRAFATSHHFHHVLGAFSKMGPCGIVPDGFLLPSAIKAYAALHALNLGDRFMALLMYLCFPVPPILDKQTTSHLPPTPLHRSGHNNLFTGKK
ncbi:hypothetical protein SESBI_19650 [Sesbania bispinosa]|nr:hypothetical protein SESBI_19650 [Sesbania bispinosa]